MLSNYPSSKKLADYVKSLPVILLVFFGCAKTVEVSILYSPIVIKVFVHILILFLIFMFQIWQKLLISHFKIPKDTPKHVPSNIPIAKYTYCEFSELQQDFETLLGNSVIRVTPFQMLNTPSIAKLTFLNASSESPVQEWWSTCWMQESTEWKRNNFS